MATRRIVRPRNVAPGDTRSPMLRLLSGASRNGHVVVDYDAQWRTFFRAKRLGFVDEEGFMTTAGKVWMYKQDGWVYKQDGRE